MSTKNLVVMVSLAAALGYIGGSRAAGIPASSPMTFSGVVQNAGEPVTTDTTVRIRLFSALEGGSDLCETSEIVTPDAQGRFSLPLIDECTDVVSDNSTLFMELQVGSETLAPRQPLSAVPYAVEAKKASEASGALAIALTNLQSSVRPEQTFSAFFNASGSVVRENPPGWIQSGILNNTGFGTISFAAFAAAPVCVASAEGGALASIASVGTSSASIQTRTNQTAVASPYSVICHGIPAP